jgi:putative flippase GtrA
MLLISFPFYFQTKAAARFGMVGILAFLNMLCAFFSFMLLISFPFYFQVKAVARRLGGSIDRSLEIRSAVKGYRWRDSRATNYARRIIMFNMLCALFCSMLLISLLFFCRRQAKIKAKGTDERQR